ncbi:MAG: TetR/AcrR family transcriptional regulator [Actinomycetota bacterium]|nr:TetR/AcrR family transcriptional regulator [Actinomycetota bacterium]
MYRNSVTKHNVVTNYQEERSRGREALRRGLLDAAGRLLVEEGPGALSMRRISRQVNCSTKVLYTMFGGKRELVEELWLEGFDRLRRSVEAVEHPGNPWAYVVAMGWAYRENALANPNHYAVMFGRAVPGFEPTEEGLRRSESAFGVLVEAVEGCVEAGVVAPSDPRAVASVLWSMVHGLVSLELAGHMGGEGPGVFGEAMRVLTAGYLIGERRRDG